MDKSKRSYRGKFPYIEPSEIKKSTITFSDNHEGFSTEKILGILRRCFERTENIRDVAIDESEIPQIDIYNRHSAVDNT